MSNRVVVYSGVGILVVIVLLGTFFVLRGMRFTPAANSLTEITETSPCAVGSEPVCGSNGVTYDNNCERDRAGVTVAYTGACREKTELTDLERKNLFWLLQQRLNVQLPSYAIKHRATSVQRCLGCYGLYYAWEADGEPVTAMVRLEGYEVVEAYDSAGYDYVNREQGASRNIPIPQDNGS